MGTEFTEVQDKIIRIFKEKKTFLILSHVYPDGDSLGSSLGVGLFLSSQLKKQVDVGIDGAIPHQYAFLPGKQLLKTQDKLGERYEVTIVIECPDKLRCGSVGAKVKQHGIIVNIDHHKTNLNFAEVNYVDTSASAVGEQIYHLLSRYDANQITPEIATCLYTAIVTDTGRFSYSNTTPDSMEIAAKLFRIGVNPFSIFQSIYEQRSLALTQLLGNMLKTLTILDKTPNAVAYAYISQQMFQETGTSPRETEGFIDFIRALEIVEVAILFQDPGNGKIKASFRSKGKIDVAALAAEFDGGGHKAAAGCTVEGTLDSVMNRVIPFVQQQVSQLIGV